MFHLYSFLLPGLLFTFISSTLQNQTMCFITDVSVVGNTQLTGRTTVYISDLLSCVFLSLLTWDQLQRKWQYVGKTTEINNISSHQPTLSTLSPISPFICSFFLYMWLVRPPTLPLNLHFYLLHLQGCDPWPMKLICHSVLHKLRRLTHSKV